MGNLQLDMARFQVAGATQPAPASRKVTEAAAAFESVFIAQMLETAWSTVPTDGPMGGGMGESVFRSLMIQDIGRQMADQGGIGLAPQVTSELLRMQEGRTR